MRNKVVKKLLMIAMAVTMISGTSLATVYANANPPAEETTTAVVEETTTEKSKDTEKAEDTGRVTGESNNSAFSTPANAQLVDDKENDDTKQFLTIQTKKGNTFYMVIDRSRNTENVYMMSLVDENDLAEFLVLRMLSNRLMKRIHKNYRFIVTFNAGLILLGVGGILQPTTSALLHNTSTLYIGIKSMGNLLDEPV